VHRRGGRWRPVIECIAIGAHRLGGGQRFLRRGGRWSQITASGGRLHLRERRFRLWFLGCQTVDSGLWRRRCTDWWLHKRKIDLERRFSCGLCRRRRFGCDRRWTAITERSIQIRDETDHRFILWIRFEQPIVPAARFLRIASLQGEIAERAQRDEVLRIQHQRAFENLARLLKLGALEQRLAVDDLAAHVARHLGQVGAADLDGALGLASFPILVRQWREVAARILVEFCLKFPKPIVVHQLPLLNVTAARGHPLKDA
jgi:hypothetical protein